MRYFVLLLSPLLLAAAPPPLALRPLSTAEMLAMAESAPVDENDIEEVTCQFLRGRAVLVDFNGIAGGGTVKLDGRVTRIKWHKTSPQGMGWGMRFANPDVRLSITTSDGGKVGDYERQARLELVRNGVSQSVNGIWRCEV